MNTKDRHRRRLVRELFTQLTNTALRKTNDENGNELELITALIGHVISQTNKLEDRTRRRRRRRSTKP